MSHAVDIFPFAARTVSGDGEYAVWWEDLRDVHRVEVTFAEPVAAGDLPELHYWQHSWPKVHVPKNAVVGAGEQGWLANDDWITGRWQVGAVQAEGAGRTWTYTFRPLDQENLSGAASLPVTFRRTLKVRLYRAAGEPTTRGQSVEGPGAGLPRVERIAVYSDSEWREVELCLEWGGISSHEQRWDGRLEAFNGAVLGVEPLCGDCLVSEEGAWRSTVSGDTAGVRARVRYAWNDDRNSHDRTILTLRLEAQQSFSVCVNDVAAGEDIYLPHLGVVVARAEGYRGLAAIRSRWESKRQPTIYQRVASLPEQTWERAWAEMPQKSRWYFVLGCEGGRQKYRLEPNGDLLLPQNYIRRVKGKDTDRLLWEGETLALRFGLPDPATRELVEGYLPIMQTSWATTPISVRQEALATWLLSDILDDPQPQGDDPIVALLHFTLMNTGRAPETARLTMRTGHAGSPQEALRLEGDWAYAEFQGAQALRFAVDPAGRGSLHLEDSTLVYEVALRPGESHAITVKAPFVALRGTEELAALAGLRFEEQRQKVAAFWRGRVAQGMQITTPNAELNRYHRAHLTHMLIINDREPGADRRAPRCGGFHYGNFPDEGVMCTSDLDRRGYLKEAEQCLEIMVHYQGTVPLPGDFETQFGVLYGSGGYEAGGYNRGQGWAMWGLAEHYRYSRDKEWLRRVAPAIIKACDWVTHERRRTMQLGPDGRRPISYGFLPAGSLEDVTDYWHWLSSNAYASWGFTALAEVLGEIEHPEAARLQQEAAAFRRDLMIGFNESQARSPVVKLADGSYVPYYPARLERRGRDFGWLREVLEGSLGLLVSELIALDDPAAQWILDDYEDNLYMSEGFGYANSIPDFERYWFSRGGFSMQSNLLLHPAIYLKRDDVKQFLRAFFNGFASTYYPETCMSAEHALPTLADARGDHFKASDEANVTHYLRLMLIEEHGQDLILGKAIPRAWLEQGKEVTVERALTYFGPMGYRLRSAADQGYIEADIELPQRNAPERSFLRLRHPRQESLRRVEINGQPWSRWDASSEMIELPVTAGPLHVVAWYK